MYLLTFRSWRVNFKLIYNTLYLFYAIASGMTLYETIFLGYHTLRQCLYGITLGITSHILYANSIKLLPSDPKVRHSRYMTVYAYLFVYWILSVFLNVWYETVMGHHVQWNKMIPSTIFTVLCGVCGYLLGSNIVP
jgi:hypothetical protein